MPAKTTKRTAKRATKQRARKPASPLPRHRQYGAVPLRFGARDQLEVLLVTSRGTGRWVIPKGWPMRGRTPAGTARREAYEEAGVKGRLLSKKPIGSYRYFKHDEVEGEILVRVFLLAVEQQKKDWPEKGERRARWFTIRAAAALVKERDLARLLRAVPGMLVGGKGNR
jgi:8-oxo-dGTP pyrophosphatase MutT (NUDIX family)